MDADEILLNCEDHMDKALAYLTNELKGVRTGRASPSLVEFVKVDCYGAMSDLRTMANVSVPEPTQLLIKPFDPGTTQAIAKAIQAAGLGLNPMTEGKQIRVNIPPLSGDRRKQLAKDKAAGVSEDQAKQLKEEIQKLTDQHEKKIEELLAAKSKEILEV